MPYQIPMPNRLTDQLHATGTTIDILRIDENLFSNLTLPNGIDRDLVIDTIIEKHGMTALIHPSPDWMKHFIGVWSRRRVLGWGKLLATTEVEYDPIENYNRKEDSTDTRNTEGTNSSNTNGTQTDTGSAKASETRSGNAENESRTDTTDSQETSQNAENKGDVSAENASDYQPDTRSTGTSSGTTKNEGSSSTGGSSSSSEESSSESNTSGETKLSRVSEDSHKESETHVFTNRVHGNIGVTTTQQMLQSERELVRYSLAEEIAEDYRDAFCLGLY